jgi:topoisomerase-4 subunit A
VVIKEIPPTTTSETLIATIEDAARKGKIKIRSINDFTAEQIEIEIKTHPGVDPAQLVPALYAFTGCETTISSRIIIIKDNRPVEMTVSEVLREATARLLDTLKRELELNEHKLLEDLFFKTLVQIFIENRIYKTIEQCKSQEAINKAIFEGFEPFKNELYRELRIEDVDMLLSVRIRRISLFDINKHRQDMQKVQAELAQVRKNLKSLVKYAIARLKGLLEKYGPIYPRCTRSSRFDEVEAKEVAFKSFKVTYDREKGYIGYKVGGDEFTMDCSEFDKLLLVFKDGRYKVVDLQDKLFIGPDLIYCAVPDRDRVMTLAYSNREATFLKRFTFGGAILNKEYNLIPPKSKILFFEPNTPAQIYIKYKPAPYQKVDQQIAKPEQLAVKGVKAVGNQISIKDVGSINSKPPRNWDKDAPTTPLNFT